MPIETIIPVSECVAADNERSIECGTPKPGDYRHMTHDNEPSADDFQRLSELSLRCAKNCRRLQEMAGHSEPPPGLDALLAEMRRDLAEGLPLAEKFSDQLAAASPGPFQAGEITASSRTLGNLLLAQAMLQTVDKAEGRRRTK